MYLYNNFPKLHLNFHLKPYNYITGHEHSLKQSSKLNSATTQIHKISLSILHSTST